MSIINGSPLASGKASTRTLIQSVIHLLEFDLSIIHENTTYYVILEGHALTLIRIAKHINYINVITRFRVLRE